MIICNGQCIVFSFFQSLSNSLAHFKPLFILDSLHPSLYETISNGAACIQDAQKRTIKTVITANNELRLEHMLDD